jgi:hypothetical protein
MMGYLLRVLSSHWGDYLLRVLIIIGLSFESSHGVFIETFSEKNSLNHISTDRSMALLIPVILQCLVPLLKHRHILLCCSQQCP